MVEADSSLRSTAMPIRRWAADVGVEEERGILGEEGGMRMAVGVRWDSERLFGEFITDYCGEENGSFGIVKLDCCSGRGWENGSVCVQWSWLMKVVRIERDTSETVHHGLFVSESLSLAKFICTEHEEFPFWKKKKDKSHFLL